MADRKLNPGEAAHEDAMRYRPERLAMVREVAEIFRRAATPSAEQLSADVRRAMEQVPRHRFVPPELRDMAYENRPLPIGYGQTISQPFIVALMTQLAEPRPGARVLEVGTGSGYQAAVLGELGADVDTIEIVPELAERAARELARLGVDRVAVRCGDGWAGWPEHAPFDAILVTAAGPDVPAPLIEQLAVGGRLVLPVGEAWFAQDLQLLVKGPDGALSTIHELPVTFVPLTRLSSDERNGEAS
jgi:protein-L-isoaspartate(D-aspartate) O-methyltransferase